MKDTNHIDADRELITFHLASQEFCVDIIKVREIRGWTKATSLPMSPDYVRGVINLRGDVLPIIDLAARLGFAPTEPTAHHVIIVCQIGSRVAGLVVEAVSDILTVSDDAIQQTPDVASDTARNFVVGLLTLDGRMISLISLDDVLPQNALPQAA